jgi:hypothetical protein
MNHLEWSPDQALLPFARIEGHLVHVHNIRHCSYVTAQEYTVRHYDRTFDLDRLQSVDFIVEPFSRWGLAHTFLSFGFAGVGYLAISIEVRKRVGEQFSPLKGLLRRFQIMYVIGDERDLIHLRANLRQDPVYIYPVMAPLAKIRELFLNILARANQLHARPEFYNTLTNNCTTNIVAHVNTIAPRKIPRSWRIIFPAFSDRLAYHLGLIDTTLSFREIRRRYRINDRARQFANDPDFSKRIRQV